MSCFWSIVRAYRGRILTAGMVFIALLTIWQLHLIFRLEENRTILSYLNIVEEAARSNSGRNSNSSSSTRNSSSSSNSSPDGDHSIVASWPDVQQSRKDQLQKACQALRKEQQRIEIQEQSQSKPLKGNWSPPTLEEEFKRISHSRQDISNIYVDDANKLIYCNVPNVNSVQWKKVMILLSGSKYTSTNDISDLTAHVKNNLTSFSHKKYSAKRLLFRLKTFSKVLTVRDPLERLLSAYRNKFAEDAPLSNLYHNMYGRNWIPFVRRDSNNTRVLQFDEMLEYLSRHSGPTDKFNGYWRPIFDLCHPCIIQYDFIANFATQEHDGNEILTRVLRGSQNSGLWFPEVEKSSTGDRLKELLTTLNPELVRDVQRKYYKDYDMFGYRRFT